MSILRITVTNDSPAGGTFLTPFWFGLHDDGFDLFEVGGVTSAGLEAIAEDGTFDAIVDDLLAGTPDGQGGVVTGAAGPIATDETTFLNVDVNDPTLTPLLSLAAMVLPSNDAFVGTDAAIAIFDEAGDFLGPQTIVFTGEDVLDAGTEVNTELDAAFINQMGPNTGIDEGSVIVDHPGFNGSDGNPVGGGDQIILGGTNAFGEFIDPVIADFTLPGAGIATVVVQEVELVEGDETDETFDVDELDGLLLVDGGDGDDSVDIDDDFSDLSVIRSADGFRFVEDDGDEIEVNDVESLSFDDASIVVSTDTDLSVLGLIYQVALDRDADVAGLSFWSGALAAGLDFGDVGEFFLDSIEFTDSDGDTDDSTDFLNEIYQKAFGRDGDEAGLAFWGGLLDDGAISQGDVVAAFAQSEEAETVFADDIANGFLIFS
ncbi:MAG: spondin domain-containing protein [Pseudomonadota bacterium]